MLSVISPITVLVNTNGRGLTTHRRVKVKRLRVRLGEELEVEDGEFREVVPEGRKERIGE